MITQLGDRFAPPRLLSPAALQRLLIHELFHVLVVTASVFHWLATYRFMLPAAGAM